MKFTFWKENKLDQEFKLTIEELKVKYLAYLKTKEESWIEYYGHQTVAAFIGDADGLNSVGEMEDIETLQNELKETRQSLYV